MFNLANNGVLTRIDQRGERAGELFSWGLHLRTAEAGSPLTADDPINTAELDLLPEQFRRPCCDGGFEALGEVGLVGACGTART